MDQRLTVGQCVPSLGQWGRCAQGSIGGPSGAASVCCCRVAVCGRPALAAERLTAGLPLTEKRRIGASNRKIRAGSRQAGSAWINSLGGKWTCTGALKRRRRSGWPDGATPS